jgi:hypothetical protein
VRSPQGRSALPEFVAAAERAAAALQRYDGAPGQAVVVGQGDEPPELLAALLSAPRSGGGAAVAGERDDVGAELLVTCFARFAMVLGRVSLAWKRRRNGCLGASLSA